MSAMEQQMVIVAVPPQNPGAGMPPIVAAPLQNPAAGQAPRPLMAHLPIRPGTPCSLALRAVQSITTVLALGAMTSANDFHTVPAFVFIVAASALQCLWAISLGCLDIYALMEHFQLGNHWTELFTFGDVIATALTFFAATASSGMILEIHTDFRVCGTTTKNCRRFEAATGMVFLSFVTFLPSFGLNWLKLHALLV